MIHVMNFWMYAWLFFTVSTLKFTRSARFPATPGEFPQAVVIFRQPDKQLYAGVLATDIIAITTCRLLSKEGVGGQINFQLNLRYELIASNGDWKNDPLRQTRQSQYIVIHSDCKYVEVTPTQNITFTDVGAIVVAKPFQVTMYVLPMMTMAKLKTAQDLKDRLANILSTKTCQEPKEKTDYIMDCPKFTIGGFMCPEGRCSDDSPMYRSITEMLGDHHCTEAISFALGIKHFTTEELKRTKSLCFTAEDVGGGGSPVTVDLLTIAIGSQYIKTKNHEFFLATRFDAVVELLQSISGSPSFTISNMIRKVTLLVVSIILQ